jgi:hypothetical protein
MSKKEQSVYAIKGVCLMLVVAFWSAKPPVLIAQTLEEKVDNLARQVLQLSDVITELRSEVARSHQETRELRLQLSLVDAQSGSGSGVLPEVGQAGVENPNTARQEPSVAPASPEDRLTQLEDSLQLLDDRLEEHYQTKVESSSRYRVRLSGIVLMNAFTNYGRVDTLEVPDLALRTTPTDTGRTFGFSALQSQVGLETYGPELAGAKTSAGLQFDFFGISSNSQYASSWGSVRLRTAAVRMDWPKTSIIVSQDAPFISPLSPNSIATLAYPAFSYSGNLWTWIPQARVEHRLNVSEKSTFSIQGGFLDPVPRGPAQPGYAARFAWTRDNDDERPLTLGLGAYYGREDRGAGRTEDGWAGTVDWLVPLGSRFTWSGEFFRGRAIGNFGAAQGRSVVFSGPEADPSSSMSGINTVGGWTQLSFKATSTVEFNGAYGEDRPFERDLFEYSSTPMISRNGTQMYNVIYRPRTNLVFSLEYRRFKTWRIDTYEDASHMNLGVGVLF